MESKPALLAIRITPAKPQAPQVLLNRGLVVLEGGEGVINFENLEIVDSDNIDKVEIHVKGGLKYGSL